jgi:hypothetical protein
VIVRDQGDSWQVVAQPDHGDVCGAFARAWGNARFAAPRRPDSLFTAARRHDDGWAIWERTPNLDPRDGRPLNVFDVQVPVHLAFFRAMIAAVTDEDAYGGVLVSMHAAGLYTHRYGTDPSLRMTMADDARPAVDAFVADRNTEHDAQARALGIPDADRWVDYKLLQTFDRLCLYLCLNDLIAGTPAELAPVPASDGADDTTIAISPVGAWAVALEPFPFAASPSVFSLPRRVFPKARWSSRRAFAEAYLAMEPEPVTVTMYDRADS